jgi:phosphoglycerol transferase
MVTTAWGRTSAALVEVRGLARARGAAAWWPYPSAAILSVALVVVLLQLWRADLRVPFTYRGEAIYNGMLVKGVLEQGWHLDNPALGAPASVDLRDVPMSDNNLHFAVIRILGLGTSNYARVMNAFFLLTFPLTALTALFALRRFRLAAGPALCGSLLYTFLPFHFGRGQHHLFLAAYYLVPLGIMVALWIMLGVVSLVDEERRWSCRHGRGKLLVSVIVCALIGSGGVYYAFFTCLFLLVAGGVAAVRRGDARHLVLPAALVAVTAVVITVNFLPSIVHVYQHGTTPLIRRNPADAEVYGLRISQLILPVTGHRLPWVARFKDFLDAERGVNESNLSSLGIVGSLGFLALLGALLIGKPEVIGRDEDVAGRALHDVGILNVAAVLVATTGGIGSLIALLVTSKIRAYNRISVFIAFFSVFAVVVGLDALYRRYGRTWRARAVLVVCFMTVLGLGVIDQTSPRAVTDYARVGAEYGSDSTFVHQIEQRLPPGAMVFQLPMVPYPEHPMVQRMPDYDHGRGYLHSKRLRWSYGAVKGREGEAWQRWVTAKPVPEMVETLTAAGFSGLYLNRFGYADWGVRLSDEISTVLDQRPLRTHDDRLRFFDLTAYRDALRAHHTPAQWRAKQDEALHPVLLVWHDGCADPEGTPEKSSRWCANRGEWRLINRASHTKRVTFEAEFTSPHPGNLRIESALLSGWVRLGPVSHPMAASVSVPPGQHTIRFACDAPRALAPGDDRPLVFRVLDFKVIAAPSGFE